MHDNVIRGFFQTQKVQTWDGKTIGENTINWLNCRESSWKKIAILIVCNSGWDLFCYYLKNSWTDFTSVILQQTFSVINNFKNSCTYCTISTSIIFWQTCKNSRTYYTDIILPLILIIFTKFDDFLPLFILKVISGGDMLSGHENVNLSVKT